MAYREAEPRRHGSSTNLSGNPTYQDLTSKCAVEPQLGAKVVA